VPTVSAADLAPLLAAPPAELEALLRGVLRALGRDGSQARSLVEPLLELRARARALSPAATSEELGLALLALIAVQRARQESR
jgi:hypothetical protein